MQIPVKITKPKQPISGLKNLLTTSSDFLQNKKSLYHIIFLAVFVRLMFFLFWGIRTTPDSYAYIAQAEAILKGIPFPSFPNGYPLLIALVLLITGKTQLYFGLLIINLISQILTGIIIYRMGLLLFSKTEYNLSEDSIRLYASLSLIIFSLYPPQIIFTNFVLTESVTTLLLTVSIYLLLTKRYLTAGMILALASQMRTVYLPALLLTSLAVLFLERKYFLRYLSGASLTTVLMFGLDYLNITAFPINQSYNLLLAINIYDGKVIHYLSSFPSEDFANPLAAYFRYALQHPADFLMHRLGALYELWGPYSFEPNNRMLRIIFGTRFLLFVAWIYIVYRILIKSSFHPGNILYRFIIYISAPVIVITVIHPIYFSGYRFIVPLEPLMILLAVIAARAYLRKDNTETIT